MNNTEIEHKRLKQKKLEVIRLKQPRLYYALAHHKTTRKTPLNFTERPYALAIYNDNAKDIVLMKSVQCGITEFLIIDTIVNCDDGLAVFYVLPTGQLRNTFVHNRLNPLFTHVELYRAKSKEGYGKSESVEMKHFSLGTIKLVGSNSPASYVEFPADVLVIDEYDRCEQDLLAMAPDRIKSSKHKLTRKVGNPTLEGFGIHNEYKFSDQKEWVVKCPYCDFENELDFFKIVVEEIAENTYELIDKDWSKESDRDIKCFCHKCSKPFNRLSKDGRWLAKYPGRAISGYHISRLMEKQTTVAELWGIFKKAWADQTKMQAFYNSDLGVPYSAKSVALTDFLLKKCERDYVLPTTATHTILGADIGAQIHVKVSKVDGKKRIAQYIGTVNSFEEIDKIIKDYGVVVGVIDALPETHEAKKLRDRHKGKVYLCEYHKQGGSVKEMKVDKKEMKVSVDRTQSLDESHSDILLGNAVYPKEITKLHNGAFVEQMKKPKRIFDEKKGYYVWTDQKPDHYRHADNYEKIAQKILGKEPKIWEL